MKMSPVFCQGEARKAGHPLAPKGYPNLFGRTAHKPTSSGPGRVGSELTQTTRWVAQVDVSTNYRYLMYRHTCLVGQLHEHVIVLGGGNSDGRPAERWANHSSGTSYQNSCSLTEETAAAVLLAGHQMVSDA